MNVPWLRILPSTQWRQPWLCCKAEETSRWLDWRFTCCQSSELEEYVLYPSVLHFPWKTSIYIYMIYIYHIVVSHQFLSSFGQPNLRYPRLPRWQQPRLLEMKRVNPAAAWDNFCSAWCPSGPQQEVSSPQYHKKTNRFFSTKWSNCFFFTKSFKRRLYSFFKGTNSEDLPPPIWKYLAIECTSFQKGIDVTNI